MLRVFRRRPAKKAYANNRIHWSRRSFADPALVIHRELSGPNFLKRQQSAGGISCSLDGGINKYQQVINLSTTTTPPSTPKVISSSHQPFQLVSSKCPPNNHHSPENNGPISTSTLQSSLRLRTASDSQSSSNKRLNGKKRNLRFSDEIRDYEDCRSREPFLGASERSKGRTVVDGECEWRSSFKSPQRQDSKLSDNTDSLKSGESSKDRNILLDITSGKFTNFQNVDTCAATYGGFSRSPSRSRSRSNSREVSPLLCKSQRAYHQDYYEENLEDILNQLEGGDAVKQPLVSSRNTQSAARLNRIINVSFGPSYKNGSSSTLPHTRTLPCGLQTSTLRGTQDTAPTHGRGGSLREELMPRYGGHHHQQQRMDLVYVTERIISLAFPPDLDDTSYTVHLRDVAHMLSSKHGDNFRVFNLSSCVGEVSHYLPRVTELGWPPLLAPALEKLCAICKALESWLSVNSQHVAVLHDREGYEKLGVVVAAYMHYTNICASTDTALDRYAMKRFFDDKIGQLYHPSQKRYVQYFSGLLSGIIRINSSPLYLHTLTLYGVPHFEPRGGCHLFIKVYQGMTHIYTSGVYQITDGLRHVTIVLQNQRQQSGSHQNNTRITGIQLRGDVLLKAYHRRLTPQPSREIVFRAQFHTCAVSEKVLGFSRLDLDDACNDLRFPLDGGIELCFSQGGDDPPRAVSNVSCDKSPCPITAWDSMEALHTRRSDSTGPNAHSESVAHTLGPIDGSLYATVNKRKNTDVKSTSQQQSLQQQFHHLQHQQQDHRLQQHLQDQQHLQQYQRESSKGNITPYNSHIQQHHTPHRNLQYPHSTPHTPQHPLTSTQHHGHHSASSTISSSNHQLSSQHQQQQQHHLNQHHHHHHLHNQSTQQQSSNQHRHQQYQNSLQSSSSHTHHQTLSTPSPQSTAYINGRYAASIDSGFASTLTPLSPPTSDCPASSASPAARTSGITGNSQTQQHSSRDDQQTHHHIRRFSDPNQLNNMAPVAAVAARPMQGGSNNLNSSRVDARQLDELLAGMLLDIENIPDLRPGQTPAPDIDSIRCPDLSWSSSRGRSSSSRSAGGGHTTLSPVNGYGGSHHQQDSLLDTSISLSNAEDNGTPYHTRMDSRPFSYGAVTSSPVMPRRRSPSSPSTSPTRRSSREPMINRSGLESPRLVRKMSGSVGAVSSSISDIPAPISSGGGINSGILGNDPNDMRSDRPSMSGGGMHSSRRSPSPSPEPGSRGSTLRRERSQTLTNRIMAGDPSPPPTLTRSHVTRSASRLDDPDTIFSPDTLSRSLSGTSSSWLATQQRKLIERREAGRRADRGRNEARVMSELRHRIGQLNKANTNTLPSTFSSRYGRYGDFEDGYVSDTTLFSDTSRESSPMKYNHQYIPLSISTSQNNHSNTINSSYYTNSRRHGGNSYNSHQQNSSSNASAPPSPNVASKTATLNFARDRLQRLSQHYANTTKTLTRKYSDASYDRERPFVTVKRAFNVDKGESALSQLQSAPHGHINYYPSSSPSDGLLTTMHQQSGDELNWQSDPEGHHSVHRPHTPGFPPSTPTTPYLNQGLPPKSPTMQRRAHLGLSSLNQRPPSAGSTSSTLSKEPMVTSTSSAAPNYRSPSPHGLNNGHTSPAPSLYHGPSRRSSLSSLNDSGQEVIHSHPKFVKDISKYWYKPTISRDEAINILKTKPPGTFIVRDSNSFPGAFGLAVKVAIPPPNVKASTTGGDMSNELVRHFLIEPTARGVRLKGCSNEPVFGSLSALVYQHSITALALPCRLTLPEKDPAGPSTPSTPSNGTATVDNNALLHQGAACTVLYLHSMDMESLTGPQAVRRAVSSLLEYSGKGTPTPVHFKVSSAGITLTDNHRTLFFRQHYPVNSISHCGLDPDDRRWQHNSTETGEPLASLRMFGFVAKKGATRAQNQCHILAELEPEQPATAICNFVTKVMMTSANRSNLV